MTHNEQIIEPGTGKTNSGLFARLFFSLGGRRVMRRKESEPQPEETASALNRDTLTQLFEADFSEMEVLRTKRNALNVYQLNARRQDARSEFDLAA